LRLTLDHVAIPVGDAAQTRRFYSEVLGLSLVDAHSGDDWDGHPWLMMVFADADGRQLALCAYRGLKRTPERVPTDARHYAFATTAPRELAAWKRRLEAAGVAYREEDHGVQRSIYFEDPSGNILEITSAPSAKAVAEAKAEEADALVESWAAAS
jgi:catechol 2,3-dioxygenase-like lactoylglutathione lyase family enzyme